MAAKLTRLTHKIAIQLQLVAESSTVCSSHSRPSVRKLLDARSYIVYYITLFLLELLIAGYLITLYQ